MEHVIVSKYGERKTVWVSESLLIERARVDREYLRVRARPYYKQNGNTWQYKVVDGRFYYNWEKIPNKAPNYYQNGVGTKAELQGMAEGWGMSASEIKAIGRAKIEEAFKGYELMMLEAVIWYNKERHTPAIELAEAYCWAKFLLEYGNKDDRRYIGFGLEKVGDVYEIVTEILKEKKLMGMRISNEIALRNKMTEFKKVESCMSKDEQYKFFVHSAFGNNHAEVMGDECKQVAILMRGMSYNWSDQTIVRKLQVICYMNGWKVPSERKIEDFLNTKEVQTITEQSRYGIKGRYRRITLGNLPIASPLFASDCWQADATRVNMIAHKRIVKKKDKYGKEYEIERQDYLSICVVRDVYSRAILGWSYGYSETHAMYVNALQMAYETAGHLPYEFVYDRFPGSTTPQWKSVEEGLCKAGVKLTQTSEATGKAQLERTFGTLQSVFMADTIWYYGEGIKSKRRYAHRGDEQLEEQYKIAKEVGWDYNQTCDAMDGVIERYNNTKISSYSRKQVDQTPNELFAESEKISKIDIPTEQAIWLFNLQKTLAIRGAGMLKTEILNNTIYYRVEEYEIVKRHKKVVLCYDLRDLSSAVVFSESGVLLCEVKEVAPVQVFGPDAEQGRMSHERAMNEHFAERARQEYEQITEGVSLPDEVAINNPLLASKGERERAESIAISHGDIACQARNDGFVEDEDEPAELTEEQMKQNLYKSIAGK